MRVRFLTLTHSKTHLGSRDECFAPAENRNIFENLALLTKCKNSTLSKSDLENSCATSMPTKKEMQRLSANKKP